MNILYDNDEKNGVLKRSIVANTYLYLDSHGDVHMPGIFSKTITDRKNRISHLHDHKFELSAKVGRPISFNEVKIRWSDVGVSKNGETYVLQMDSKIEKSLNASIYNEYLQDAINQHSVCMQYEEIEIAMNDENYSEAFKAWNEVYPLLGNPEKADELGMFYVVRKAKLIEVSAVLLGSNELTPTLGSKNYQFLGEYSKALKKSISETKKESKSMLSAEDFKKHYKPSKHIK